MVREHLYSVDSVLGSSRSRETCRRYDVDVVSDGAIHAGSRVHLAVLAEILV